MKVFIFGVLLSSLVYGETQVYSGTATLKGKKVYEEKHRVEIVDNKVINSLTEYYGPGGELLGVLKNNYANSLSAPEHEMKDLVHKTQHGVRYMGNVLVMYNINDEGKEETESLDVNQLENKLVVGGQGLHYYLVTNMEEVIKKKKLDLKFLIPGRLDAYNFYLKVIKSEQDLVTFEIEIDNWLLKLFAPKLKLVYSRITPRLLKYSGLSNITDKKKDMMNVEIIYNYNN